MTVKAAPVVFSNSTLQMVHLTGRKDELSFVVDAATPNDGVKMVASALPTIGKTFLDFSKVEKAPFTANMVPSVLADGFDFFVGPTPRGTTVCVPLVSPKDEVEFDTIGTSPTARVKRAIARQAHPAPDLLLLLPRQSRQKRACHPRGQG